MLKPTPQKKSKLYFASPLFCIAELEFNRQIVKLLEQNFEVFLPQRDGCLLAEKVVEGENPMAASMLVFQNDIKAMNECDIILAILDGRTVDEGVAFEIGYSFGLGKECYGFKSDSRYLLPTGNNPMIDQALKCIFKDIESLISWAENYEKRSKSRKIGRKDVCSKSINI